MTNLYEYINDSHKMLHSQLFTVNSCHVQTYKIFLLIIQYMYWLKLKTFFLIGSSVKFRVRKIFEKKSFLFMSMLGTVPFSERLRYFRYQRTRNIAKTRAHRYYIYD